MTEGCSLGWLRENLLTGLLCLRCGLNRFDGRGVSGTFPFCICIWARMRASGRPSGTEDGGWQDEPDAGSRSPEVEPLANEASLHGERKLRYSPQGAVSKTVWFSRHSGFSVSPVLFGAVADEVESFLSSLKLCSSNFLFKILAAFSASV